MAKPHDKHSADLVRAALRFHRLGMWREIPRDQAFLLRLPEDTSAMVVLITGPFRPHFGFMLYRGIDAIHDARLPLVTNEPHAQLGSLRSTALLATFTRFEGLPHHAQRFLESNGFIGRSESTVPRFSSLPQREHGAMPSRNEMRILLGSLRAMNAIRANEPLASGDLLFDDVLPAYHVSADGRMIGRTTESVAPIESNFGRALLDLSQVADRAASEQSWLLGFADLRSGVVDSTSPHVRCFLVFDASNGHLIHLSDGDDAGLMNLGREFRQALANADAGGVRIRPKEIVFHDWRLGFRLLAPALAEVGIAAKHVHRSEAFDRYSQVLATRLVR